jgi:hypothetical protein
MRPEMTQRSKTANKTLWIEEYCVVPAGPHKGRCVQLTFEQRETIRRI